MCPWILDYLTARHQVVRAGGHTSHSLILNIAVPHGGVLSPLLYSLYTHDERAYLQDVSDLRW